MESALGFEFAARTVVPWTPSQMNHVDVPDIKK